MCIIFTFKMYAAKCVLVLCAAFAAVSGYNLGTQDVIFHLFTRSNPTASQPLLPSVSSIISSSFSLSANTIITLHSYSESVAGNFNAFIVPALMERSDVNVIAVDWSAGAASYSVGLANSPQAGEVVATFINIMINNFGYSPSMFRIVGVGLGAHVAGIAARRANGVIPHVVALNPSLIGWTHHPDKLGSDAATLVEVLHTTGGITGYDRPLGHLDFYPNGGSYQNGCGGDASCSNTYAYAFYTESIMTELWNGARFVGTACGSYDEAIRMRCSGSRDVIFGGSSTSKSGESEIYTFSTNPAPPFARN